MGRPQNTRSTAMSPAGQRHVLDRRGGTLLRRRDDAGSGIGRDTHNGVAASGVGWRFLISTTWRPARGASRRMWPQPHLHSLDGLP